MSYRFCFGASGSGKSRTLHNWILEQAERSLKEGVHARDNYVIIVPDQYSMQTQKEIVTESPHKGILNIDVLSFGRLTHKVFEEIGVPKRAVLDDTGKTLLLRRVAGRHAGDLKILGRSIHYPGMIAEVKSVLSEFMQYGIGGQELEAMQKYASDRGQGALSARLHDLQVLYDAFLTGDAGPSCGSDPLLRMGKAQHFCAGWLYRLYAGAVPRSFLSDPLQPRCGDLYDFRGGRRSVNR